MRRALSFALFTAILAGGTCFAQEKKAPAKGPVKVPAASAALARPVMPIPPLSPAHPRLKAVSTPYISLARNRRGAANNQELVFPARYWR